MKTHRCEASVRVMGIVRRRRILGLVIRGLSLILRRGLALVVAWWSAGLCALHAHVALRVEKIVLCDSPSPPYREGQN